VSDRTRVTTRSIREAKGKRRVTVLTCYDYPFARILDRCGIDILLVGDSLGNVVLGYPNTIPVTIDEMIHHARAVMRAAPRALVVVDMPFGTFQVGERETVEAAIRIMKDTGADAVKLEGGRRNADAIRRLTDAGIPVMGHVGLTPQSVLQFGGYRVQGRGNEGSLVLAEARALEDAGCFSVVLESIPAGLAETLTQSIDIPTIGIGAGPACDGQVLVLHDMLGLYDDLRPKFVRRYVELGALVQQAVAAYKQEVDDGSFPGPEHSYGEGKTP
jgi:3-methyl-2-oxobutanoate hydroxymethyltransferase